MNKYVLGAIGVAIIILTMIFVIKQPNSQPVSEEAPKVTQAVPTEQPVATTAPATVSGTPTTAAKVTESKEIQAIIKTSKGNIVLQLYPSEAPKTVANFVAKAKSGYYANLTFHRVEDWVLQGGDPLGNGTGGGQMATELNSKSFVLGSLGVARGGDIKVSNDSQFFIVKSDATWLDNQYTNFGIVTSGMDVVNKMVIGDKILEIVIK